MFYSPLSAEQKENRITIEARLTAGWRFKPQIRVEGLKGKNLVLQYNSMFEQEVSANSSLEGIAGGEVVVWLGDGEPVPLRENSAFRFPDTLEDFEPLRLTVVQRPEAAPQQCDFVSPPARVTGKTDLYTSTGLLVEGNQVLNYHSFGANALLGYTLRVPAELFAQTEFVPFAGAGPRYVSLRSAAPLTLLGMVGPGATAGFNWYYKWSANLQPGLRYHADLVYISGEPVILQHAVGLQMGLRL